MGPSFKLEFFRTCSHALSIVVILKSDDVNERNGKSEGNAFLTLFSSLICTYLQMAKRPGRCLKLSGCWDGAFIRDFKDLVCISEFCRWCALSRNNQPGKPLKTDAGQQEQKALPGLGNAMAFPGWLIVTAQTPRKQRTAFSSFFFEWLPGNTNTSLRNANPICFLHHWSCFRRIYNVANRTEKKVLENEVTE